ncbi:MAG: hypothetical protein ABI165_02270 [Bryobacteraceae bacterium]
MATSPVNPALSLLTQSGSVLASAAANLPAQTLQNASPQDLVSLSDAALQLQQVEGLFGIAAPGAATQGPFSTQPPDLLTLLEQTLASQQQPQSNLTTNPYSENPAGVNPNSINLFG